MVMFHVKHFVFIKIFAGKIFADCIRQGEYQKKIYSKGHDLFNRNIFGFGQIF